MEGLVKASRGQQVRRCREEQLIREVRWPTWGHTGLQIRGQTQEKGVLGGTLQAVVYPALVQRALQAGGRWRGLRKLWV